jgi:hypothetical protein
VPAGEGDLFSAELNDRLSSQAPLAARMRPRTLDGVVGQRHLLAEGRPLRALIEADRLSSVILWGPPGTGKTTLAQVIAGSTDKAFIPNSRGAYLRRGRSLNSSDDLRVQVVSYRGGRRSFVVLDVATGGEGERPADGPRRPLDDPDNGEARAAS